MLFTAALVVSDDRPAEMEQALKEFLTRFIIYWRKT